MRNLWKRHKVLLVGIPCVLLIVAGVALWLIGSRNQRLNASLEEGNRCLEELDYNQAVVYYRQALEVDDSNRDANLGLAEAYQGLGQDSYAESVYQDMLAEDDSQADVYELLAQLYIQQSKLDEARQLLDEASQKVEDEEITVLYQLTRPEPPTTSYDAGAYQDRIAVELIPSASEQVIYYTLDGTDPTVDSPVYTEPLILPNGVTQLRAIAVNSIGYQSDIAVYEYDLQIRDVEITLEEPVIERIIRDTLDIPGGQPIYNDDIEQITELYIVGDAVSSGRDEYTVNLKEGTYIVNGSEYTFSGTGQIRTLNDLQYMPYLSRLVVGYQGELDISGLSRCTGITELSLVEDQLSDADIQVLAGLTQLQALNLGWNEISSLSPLSGLTGLTTLSVWGNRLSSLAGIEGLVNLTYLDFSDNQITDITPVQGMTALEELWMYDNQVSSLTGLTGLESLRVLMLKGNPIEDLETVRAIYPRLERLDVDLLNLGGEEE